MAVLTLGCEGVVRLVTREAAAALTTGNDSHPVRGPVP